VAVKLLLQCICNLDISFPTNYTLSNDDGDNILILNCHTWLKQHLMDMGTVLLNLLPLILQKADRWKFDTGHSHLDILFFLLKEKNPILLQNVRRQ
jgi:hypothetical protein